jgi:hypothetical protein
VGGAYLQVRQPVLTFGFEALGLLVVVEGCVLRGMVVDAQAEATTVWRVIVG